MKSDRKAYRIFLIVILLLVAWQPIGGKASAREEPEGEASPALSPQALEDLEILEARLRAAAAQLRGAEGYKRLEATQLEEAERQRKIGATSPRSLQLAEVQAALADAWYQTHVAHLAEARIRLEQAKRRQESDVEPEKPDAEQLRAELSEDLEIRETMLKALESQVKAGEQLLESERASLENYTRLVLSGRSPAITGEQARFRVVEAESWLNTVRALRDEENVRLKRAKRLLDSFQEEREADPEQQLTMESMLVDQIKKLNQEVESLRQESLTQRRFIQMLLNRTTGF
jgi:hypothetical protein